MDEVESGVHYPQGQLSMELPAIGSHVRPPSLRPTRSRSWKGGDPVGAGRDDGVGDLSAGRGRGNRRRRHEQQEEERNVAAGQAGAERRAASMVTGEPTRWRLRRRHGGVGGECGDGGAREVEGAGWDCDPVPLLHKGTLQLSLQLQR
ncbi:unnamed protein product [Urochloa humidicola]